MGYWNDHWAGQARDRAARLRREGKDSSAAEADAIRHERLSYDEDARKRDLEREQRERRRLEGEHSARQWRRERNRQRRAAAHATDDCEAQPDCDDGYRDLSYDGRMTLRAMLERVGYYKPAVDLMTADAPAHIGNFMASPDIQEKLTGNLAGKWNNRQALVGLAFLVLSAATVWLLVTGRFQPAAFCLLGIVALSAIAVPVSSKAKAEVDAVMDAARELRKRGLPS